MIYFKYLWYVLRHKWFVMRECSRAGLYWRGVMHDISKFSPAEFGPYARYFYGEKTDKTKADFDKAWQHHQEHNSHHWEFWRNEGSRFFRLQKMPYDDVCEMVCDWRGAGMAIHGCDESAQWYQNNKDRMELHPKTRELAETLLGLYRRKTENAN